VTPIERGRASFDVPDDVAYFNTASLAPMLRSVRAAAAVALDRRSQPWEIESGDWFSGAEELRGLFARLVGAEPGGDGVALIPATSYGFAAAARNLRLGAGDRVLVLEDEYPSGIYTWRRAVRRAGAQILTVPREPGQTWADAVLAALDERVAIVSVPNVHWTDGSLVDLPAVAARARAVGARLVVDASQSVGAMPLDVGALRPDFLITVGYKWLLGPFGVGYMYVAEEHRGGEPLEENWISRAGSQDFARLVDYRDEYQPGARRFDVGQRTKFELVPMAVAALSQVLAWQPANIAAALAGVTARIAEGAAVLGLEPALQRGPHMVGVKVPGELRDAVSRALTDSRRFTAARGDVMRISPHLHITDRDVGTLLGALESAVRSR
jgi:selenocysteine lyase/cysteine desulfurase